ncbi:class I SAM-dependent methyltransferase [Embleya sp. NBC_00896]|uniref:class I SAM-dependent methyltransferase n=1 Tax=Embleya sp. NBC_00896 TaxID=2975961 RepID=UPI00386F80F6|nr:class I SAM-dependent methyltransferase [Embleya sp. NBC_00896]
MLNPADGPFPWLALLIGLGLAGGTRTLRRRLRALPPLSAAPATDHTIAGWTCVTATGVRPDASTVRAAVAHAERERLVVLDLVPGDLPTDELLTLLGRLDPDRVRRDPLARGRGAGHALLVHDDVLRRAGVHAADLAGLDPPALIELTARLKPFAADGTGHAVAPDLVAPPPDPARRKRWLKATGVPVWPNLVGGLGEAAAYTGACVTSPFWGALAFLAMWFQPYAVVAGRRPVRPRDLHRATVLRPVLAVRRWVLAVTGPRPARAPAAIDPAALRPEYARDVAEGLAAFFEDRRTTCPWCGSDRLAVRARIGDHLQGKPGRFTLERCRDCAHVFQNPRLSLAGLDYYYRDFYDGLGGAGAEALFGTMSRTYRGRAELLRRNLPPGTAPRAWLDVGTGHAHMCVVARTLLPDTVFDGLDLGDGVEGARRRGWIRTAHRGQFPELADRLAGDYDVVSMHHYLEHTRDPFAELDAAAKVLVPGGRLLIELPDPQCWYGRVLRGLWLPLFQPQHQHLMPWRNLEAALNARGFTVLAREHGRAHQGNDFTGAVSQALTALAPDPAMPWVPGGPTPLRRARRIALVSVAVPAFVVAVLLDAAVSLLALAAGARGGSNAYRLLARKDPG